jgi:ribosomal protein L11 methyltransferase
LALCGILERQAQQVIDTYAPWVLLTVKESLDGWVFLTGSPIVSSK